MARKRSRAATMTLFDELIAGDVDVNCENQERERKLPVSALKWSYSKRGVLEQCPRKFYYQYYGANRNKAKDDPEKERLHQLKAVVNRHTRCGEIIHLAIADYLKMAQLNTPRERQAWLDWTRRIFQRDISRSREGLDATETSIHRYPPKFLGEFLCEVDARNLCREAEAAMISALGTFLDAPQIAVAREWGMQCGAIIEKPFYRLGGIPFGVEGRVDLVRSDDGNIVIVDWKSGGELWQGDDSLQLAIYGIWAKEVFACETGAIRIFKAYLGSGDLTEFPMTEPLLKSARLKVLQDAQCFARMDEYGREGVAAAFTPCAQKAVCRSCSFATVCPEGKETLKW